MKNFRMDCAFYEFPPFLLLFYGLQADAPEGASQYNVKKCFTKKWEVFLNIFPFLHRWIWCDEEIKEYLKFYAYFTRMQKFFHFRHWEFFFQKTVVFFRKKCFLSMFFQRLMITVHNIWLHHFSFFYSSMQREHSQIEILSG